MTTLQTHAAAAAHVSVRPAVPADREQISNLMFFETHVHRHLDWRAPLDWLGRSPYWVLEDGARIAAALACPMDPELDRLDTPFRLCFADSRDARRGADYGRPRCQDLAEAGGATAAAIAAQAWIAPILIDAGFELVDDIVVLAWDPGAAPACLAVPPGVAIRAMSTVDLPAVAEVDAEAFDPLWCNSLEALTRAFAQASYASVAEDGSGVLGYQLSTGSPLGTHLARLAVRPAAQRRGLGAALVGDLIAHLPARGEPRLTVNTQAKNAASLALYDRLRFRLTGEHYPVYTLEIQSAGRCLGTARRLGRSAGRSLRQLLSVPKYPSSAGGALRRRMSGPGRTRRACDFSRGPGDPTRKPRAVIALGTRAGRTHGPLCTDWPPLCRLRICAARFRSAGPRALGRTARSHSKLRGVAG